MRQNSLSRISIGLSILICTLFSITTQADDTSYNSIRNLSPTAIIERGERLREKGESESVEALYRNATKAYPYSSSLLLYFAHALNDSKKYSEALTIYPRVLSTDPKNANAYRWLGYTQSKLGHYSDAIAAYKTAIELDPNDDYSPEQLAYVYARDWDRPHAEEIIEGKIRQQKTDQISTLNRIAHVFYDAGNPEAAVYWWKRGAEAKSQNAYKWLTWAYSYGYGVEQDSGTSLHYERLAYDELAWFPRLSIADSLIKLAHGWFLIVVILLSATLIPTVTVGGIGWLWGIQLRKAKSLHWTEQARRSYPLQLYFTYAMIFLVIVYSVGLSYYPQAFLPLSRSALLWLAGILIVVTTTYVKVRCERLFLDKPDSILQGYQNLIVLIWLYCPVVVIFGIMSACLGSTFDLRAALIILAAIIAVLWVNFGGLIWIGKRLGILYPAPPEILDQTGAIADRMQCKRPHVLMIRWSRINAAALIFSNTVIISEAMPSSLSKEQLDTIIAHEMGHLCESWPVRLTRLLGSFLLLPIFTMSLWTCERQSLALLLCLIIYVLGMRCIYRLARKMEERSDSIGKKFEVEVGTYAQALERLYQQNRIPAVMRNKRMPHPHLYDRLISAGITPDYPRPQAPWRWTWLVVLITATANALGLIVIWLLLF